MDTKTLAVNFRPDKALIVYKNGSYTHDHHQYYMEMHDFNEGKMLAGIPLSMDGIADLTDFFRKAPEKHNTFLGIMPKNILYYRPNMRGNVPYMVWYTPPRKQYLHFSESLHIPSGVAQIPALLWACGGGSGLSLFALGSKLRPTYKSKLYQAPFHNCHVNGGVCLGSGKIKHADLSWEGVMKYYEDLFWRTIFTHTSSASIKGNMTMMWKDLVTHPEKPFDKSVLIKANTNLAKLTQFR